MKVVKQGLVGSIRFPTLAGQWSWQHLFLSQMVPHHDDISADLLPTVDDASNTTLVLKSKIMAITTCGSQLMNLVWTLIQHFTIFQKSVPGSRRVHYFKCQQESPPAWTQEAYRHQRIKYSICCSILGEGTYLGRGYLPWDTPPPPDLAGGTYLGWEGTYLGIPPILSRPGVPTLARGIPTLGYPPSGPGQVTPSHLDLAGVPPPPVWTDWKHYLPPSFGCGP